MAGILEDELISFLQGFGGGRKLMNARSLKNRKASDGTENTIGIRWLRFAGCFYVCKEKSTETNYGRVVFLSVIMGRSNTMMIDVRVRI